MALKANAALKKLFKSLQTFGSVKIAAENREMLYRYNDALMQSLHSILEENCDEAVKMKYFKTTMEQYTEAMTELFPKLISKGPAVVQQFPVVSKSDPNRFDEIVEVEKFNPYHDSKGRFASASGYASFTTTTRDPSKQHMADAAIAREKERAGSAAGGAAPGKQPKKETAKPKEEPANDKSTIAATGKSSLPDSVLNKCREVEAKTVDRKTEKLTLVDSDGNIILEKSGGKGSVSFGAREGFHMNDTTTVTHNHPGEYGGTFSGADVKVFVDYKLKAIRAVGKEGTYSLERTSKTNSSDAYDFKQAFAKQSDSLNGKMRKEYNSQKSKVARGETSATDANKQLTDYRTSLCNDQHDWLVQNAPKYGYNYVFEPSSGGVGKMFDGIVKATEEPEDDTGSVILDGEFINGDNWLIGGEESDD